MRVALLRVTKKLHKRDAINVDNCLETPIMLAIWLLDSTISAMKEKLQFQTGSYWLCLFLSQWSLSHARSKRQICNSQNDHSGQSTCNNKFQIYFNRLPEDLRTNPATIRLKQRGENLIALTLCLRVREL